MVTLFSLSFLLRRISGWTFDGSVEVAEGCFISGPSYREEKTAWPALLRRDLTIWPLALVRGI